MVRRKRWWVLGLVAALLLLLGKGLGVFPSPGGGGEAVDAPPTAEVASAAGGASRPPTTAAPAPGAETNARGGPGGASAAQVDRLHGLETAVARAVGQNELGAGFAALDRARRGPLPQAALDGAEATLAAALERALVALRNELAEGRALAARDRLEAMLAYDQGHVLEALSGWCTKVGLPPFRTEVPEVYVPVPQPLARERLVRAYRRGQQVQGQVVDARPHEVTLRIGDAAGVTFPTFAVTQVEPVAPSADVAVELGLGALRAGDALLARTWLASALVQLEGRPGERLAELQSLLGQ